jgi:Bacterial Ig-like domain (group 3)
MRRFGVAAAVAAAGVLPIAFAAGPAAATQPHWQTGQNGCVSWKYTRPYCYLSLSTSITTPGSTLTVWGAGYKPDSTVWLSLDPDWQSGQGHNPHFDHHFALASTTTNGKGRFSQLVTIPGSAPLGGANIEGAGSNPVGGTLDLFAKLLIVHPQTGPVATTTTVSESKTWASYGHEDKVNFGVDVVPTGGGAGPTGDAVTIDIGSASCVATLSNGQGWCTIAASALPIGAGYSVSAAFMGDSGFAPSASTNVVDFAVTKDFQYITFGWLYGKTLSQSPITVSATASSGLPVSFATTTPLVCSSSGTYGTTITLLAPGLCTVVASQGGSAQYLPAASVAEFFTVPGSYHYHHHHH